MHEITFYIAMIWMTALMLICIAMVIRTRSGMVRILAFDALTLVLVALLILYSLTTDSSYYLDAALMLSLVSFISTVVAARYYSERKVF
ncbi:MAG TPA: monovalent cation/H+ antiporter complex subunit F [Thermomicrobiales bacterium]|nr:monovalent cation/H+ antiporter complex subunit F [Thermomicrobiales bacterium]